MGSGYTGYTKLAGTIAFAEDLERIEEKTDQNSWRIQKERFERLKENVQNEYYELRQEYRDRFGSGWREVIGEPERRELEETQETRDNYKEKIQEIDQKIN